MRPQILFLILLLPLQFAAQTPLEAFVNRSFEPDQTVEIRELMVPGGFVLISANGVETYVVESGSGRPVADADSLLSILHVDANERTGFDQKVQSAFSFAGNVRQAKENDERKCMQYTGVDSHGCFDKESCTVACFSVPVCSIGPLYSDGFLEAMMEWNAGRQRFDSLLYSFEQGQEAITTDNIVVQQKQLILQEMGSLSASLSKNRIFLNRTDEGCSASGTARCYEFCPKVNYSVAAIEAQKGNLNALLSSMDDVNSQPQRGTAILAAGKANDNYLSGRMARYEALRTAMAAEVRNFESNQSSLAKKVTDSQTAMLLSEVKNEYSAFLADGEAGRIRAALARNESFRQKADAFSGRVRDDLAAYDGLQQSIKNLSDRVERGAYLLGETSASNYTVRINSLKSRAAIVVLEDIPALEEEADAIREELVEEISARATGEPPAQPSGNGSGTAVQPQPGPFSCPFALAILSLAAGVAFAGRKVEFK